MMKVTFFFSVLAMHVLMVFLIIERNRLEKPCGFEFE